MMSFQLLCYVVRAQFTLGLAYVHTYCVEITRAGAGVSARSAERRRSTWHRCIGERRRSIELWSSECQRGQRRQGGSGCERVVSLSPVARGEPCSKFWYFGMSPLSMDMLCFVDLIFALDWAVRASSLLT